SVINHLGRGFKLFDNRVPTETEADRSARLVRPQADGSEDMTWPAATAGAGRAGGNHDLPQIRDQTADVQPFAADVEVAFPALLRVAIELPIGKQFTGAVPQRADVGCVRFHAVECQLRRRAHSGAKRRAERARA